MSTICFLSAMHPPRDKRVFDKEAVSLANAGFRVVHIAPSEEEAFVEQGVMVTPYPRPARLLDRLLQLPRLYRMAARVDADFYHCNEVDSWLVGVFLKVLRGKKIIFDVHEYYPATFLAGRLPPTLRPLIAGLLRLLFRLLLPFTDRLVLAQASMARDYPGAAEKSIVVGNFSPRPDPSPIETSATVEDNRVTAVHLGLISRVRGWPVLLEAFARVKSQKLRLHIIGEFNDGSREAFEAASRALGLNDRIVIDDWMPFTEAFQCLQAADIGLILFQPGRENHVYAMPHKMFDYMSAALAVLAPDFAIELRSIIKETGCGLLVDPSDPDDIARALDDLASDPEKRQRMGRQGREAVLTRYNWENEAAKLIAMYRDLEKEIRND
ncbi:MAG: glycosyltransferase family 4 protein [Chloroflexi bacterium]|nr:glycosyltransferase family 4 protein [Chloroflexota bacterium]